MAIKLAIASSSRLFCEGIRKLMESDSEITIVGDTGQTGSIEDLMELDSDIILIDHRALFGISRHALTENGHTAKFILIESRIEPSLIDGEIIELISKGVMAGILSADADGELLKKAVKVVASGELWLGHLTIKNILSQAMFIKKSITRQESEIAGLILRGYCNKEIARELKITEATVKSHCNRLFKKFNVSGRLQLGLKLKGLYEDKKFLPAN
ncbi:MAG: Transcriptional regulatory protein LiaR [Syntrophorhabdaceae bacterium PtaU1.Bin034]|jgi:DNA-binding NarL/FixJ family response regulator|nr:MAG: Transcriptional regulatory protein LiaR [Syntrophorhabdaceae bacterium PtaU1.Bin034]